MSDSLFSVEDQVVLVSGGSRGIGRELARAFALRGARVIITGRDRQTLDQAAARLKDENAEVRTMVCDVSNIEHIRNLAPAVIEDYERIDTLINVAGVNIRKPAESFTPEEYDFIVDINLRGAYFMSTEVARFMLDRGQGTQINIDSLNSDAPLKHVAPYALSKAGMKTMTRALAMEWGGRGVRVNGIAPGFILTDLTTRLWSNPTMLEWGTTNTPMGRLGQVEDLSGAAIFLASQASAFMTGQTIYVDGGMVAGMPWPIEATLND